MTQQTLPGTWTEADQIEGADFLDKADLVNVPFRATGLRFYSNDRGVAYVEVDGERVDGTTFTFNDSSSGVRTQLVSYVTGKNMAEIVNSGVFTPISLVAPNGLRVSEYDVVDAGRTKKAKTYYLTTSGKRPDAAAEPKKASRTR